MNVLPVCKPGLDSWLEDGGDLTHKEHLPVKQLRFGDTGSPLDEKEGRYTLGPLMCEGDGMLYDILKVCVGSKIAEVNLYMYIHYIKQGLKLCE
jgi:hypothetical protein